MSDDCVMSRERGVRTRTRMWGRGGVECEGGVGCGMEEGTGGAGDAVGFHRNIGESAGSDDVARSVLHVHRDGYMLRGLCHQAVGIYHTVWF